METTQRISLYRYLYPKLPKTAFKKLSFMVFFYKIGEQEGGTVSALRCMCVGGGRVNNICT
jgi:hypothetical protein